MKQKAEIQRKTAPAGGRSHELPHAKGKPLPKRPTKAKPYPAPDPFAGIESSGSVEQDSITELNALQEGFKKRAKDEADRFVLATDSEFWFAICFESRDQKEIFLKGMEWARFGDKYIDGTALARALGIDLPQVYLANKNAVTRKDKKLAEITDADYGE